MRNNGLLRITCLAALAAAFALSGEARAAGPGEPAAGPRQVDLAGLDRDMAGQRARVLVLGSVHLAELSADVPPASLEPLIERLAAFRPDVITIEAISGEGCDLMARHPAAYGPEALARFCSDTSAARAATGLDVPAAIARVEELLDHWPIRPGAAQRRALAAAQLAAGDEESALVQWLQLEAEDQRTGDGLDEALVARLRALEAIPNEGVRIAARLAARLGLQRVHPIDDHTGDNLDVDDVAAFARAIQAAWDTGAEAAGPMRAERAALEGAGDMLALYRYINRPDVLQATVESDFAAALRDASPQGFGQRYVAGWETRNLRMVANIHATIRDRPGARVLSIVGATHKPWFDSLLGQMQGVEVVDVAQVLD